MKIGMKLLCTFFLILFSGIFIEKINAEEPILITLSPNIEQVIFDGKWTNPFEWKESSHNKFSFDDGNKIHLRTAHFENFIYLQINFATDTTIDEGIDSALVCFDTKNDKTDIPQSDDFCFLSILDEKKIFTFQGNNTSTTNNFFETIQNDKNFVAVGTSSGKYDRYNDKPHASYEFKIPLDVLGRSDNYGFYISVFDGSSQNHYSWPYEIKKQNETSFSTPSKWGELISPDKSLPEFNFSILFSFVIVLMGIFIVITKLNLSKIGIFKI